MSAISTAQPSNSQKLFALSGIIAPLLFGGLLFVEGLLRPGYSHVTQAISELGQVGTPYAVIQDANFVLTGLLILLFVVGLRRRISQGRASKVGIGLLFVFPVVLVLV